MKCTICKKDVKQGILDKFKGTFVKDSKGKKHLVCSDCQENKTKEELLALVA